MRYLKCILFALYSMRHEMMEQVDCLSIVYQLRLEWDQEDEQEKPEGIQESWQKLMRQRQLSDRFTTCRRWTIGMQRSEGLSNPRLNSNSEGRELKCRMRQSHLLEKKGDVPATGVTWKS